MLNTYKQIRIYLGVNNKMKFLLIHVGDKDKRQKQLTFPSSPPLGLLYLGAILEQEGYKVEILDDYTGNISKEQLKKSLHSSDVVGISIYTYAYKPTKNISKMVKELDPDIPLLIGGPHCIFHQKQSLADFPDADISVVGEGEYMILDLAEYLQGKKNLAEINGIFYRDNGSIRSGKPLQVIKDLDDIPFPARHLVDKYEYGELPFGYHMKNMTTMITSRGCPFKCRFCSRYDNIISGFRFRQRSADNILQEFEEISDKYSSISIVDDNFLVDIKRAHRIFDELIKMGKDIELGIHGVRVDTADIGLYKKMKKAGVKYVYFGLESGNQDVLDFYNKRTTLPQIRNAVKLSRKMNFITMGSFILGAPMETREHIENTIKFACSLPLDFAGFGPLRYIKGSQLWNEAVKNNKIPKDTDEIFFFADSEHDLGNFTKKELMDFTLDAFQRFYYRPTYMVSQVFRNLLRNDYSLLYSGLKLLFSMKKEMNIFKKNYPPIEQ